MRSSNTKLVVSAYAQGAGIAVLTVEYRVEKHAVYNTGTPLSPARPHQLMPAILILCSECTKRCITTTSRAYKVYYRNDITVAAILGIYLNNILITNNPDEIRALLTKYVTKVGAKYAVVAEVVLIAVYITPTGLLLIPVIRIE